MTYRMLLSDRQRVEVKGENASDAMQKALARYPGTTITECYSGFKEWHTVHTPISSYEEPPAFIEYDVPPHFAYLPKDEGPPAELPALFDFMNGVPAIEEPKRIVTRKRQVAAKERTHA